jgi:hypothetical protein
VIEDLTAAWNDCDGCCSVSGLPFDLTVVGTGQARHPFAPSLDRIDREQPYRRDNVRLVLAIANFAMNAWGLGPLIDLSDGVHRKHPRTAEQANKATGPADASLDRESTLDADFVETDDGIVAFPPRSDMHLTILKFLADGPKTSRKIETHLANEFDIPPSDQRKGNENYPAWRYHISFCLVDLCEHNRGRGGTGEIERIGFERIPTGGTTGIYRLTNLGIAHLDALRPKYPNAAPPAAQSGR